MTPINSKRSTPSAISDQIKNELEGLGITLNSTLVRKIKASNDETVLAAIEALKDQCSRREIENPGGWLASAIEGAWTKSTLLQQISTYKPTVYTAPEDSKEELIDPEQMKKKLKGLNNEQNS